MTAREWVKRGALMTLIGAVLSGPVAVGIVQVVQPQPAWRGAETFVREFHSVQTLPYFAGFVLIAGFVGLIVGLWGIAPERLRVRLLCAVACTATFAAMVLLNYALQTTVIPSIVRDWSPDSAPVIAALTMANPTSLGWALEMWGYGVLGVATWLAAPAFPATPPGRLAQAFFTANGPISIAGALLTALGPGWTTSPGGLVAFAVWNLIVVAMAISALYAVRDTAPSPRVRRADPAAA